MIVRRIHRERRAFEPPNQLGPHRVNDRRAEMDNERHEFLVNLARYGGIGLATICGVGAWVGKQSYARESLHRQMMDTVAPLLTDKATREWNELPSLAREEIRRYFHETCLNVHAFVEEICCDSFAETLHACRSEHEQHNLLNLKFSQKVVTGTEVLNRVETIANESGTVLDHNWETCCKQVADSWGASLSSGTSRPANSRRFANVEPVIRERLQQARGRAYPVGQRPAATESLESAGATAILLLPVAASAGSRLSDFRNLRLRTCRVM